MIRVLVLWAALMAPLLSPAAAYQPKNDDEVLERLPNAVLEGTRAREMHALRGALRRNSQDLNTAVRLAWLYVKAGREHGDPRFAGYAEGILAPWWSDSEPPSAVLLIRATLMQNRHRFEPALDDLGRLLSREPGNAQAWLTKSVIHLVLGEYEDSRKGCLTLLRLRRALLAGTCLAEVDGRTGRADAALALLTDLLKHGGIQALAEERLWAMTAAADMADRLGRPREARHWFEGALSLGHRDIYLLAAFADFLIQHGDNEAVLDLLDGETRATPLLLRLATAERRLGADAYRRHRDELAIRFESERRRGGSGHPYDEAYFLLHLMDRPQDALRQIEMHWRNQKDPRAARLMADAALAADSPQVIETLRKWIESTGFQDTRLRSLVMPAERL